MTTTDIKRLLTVLTNPFHKKLLSAAVQSLDDTTNALRATNFSAGFRELTRHVLAELAPSAELKACAWFKPDETARDGITRRHRAQYVIHGGLAPDYAIDVLGIDVDADLKVLLGAIDKLNKFVHVNEDTFAVPAADVEKLAQAALAALDTLLSTAAQCREELCEKIAAQVHSDVLENVLAETVQEIDIVATHHTIEYVTVDAIEVERVTATTIYFTVYGDVEAELQWGSSSDQRRGHGATASDTFPLKCQFTSSVSAPEAVELVRDSLLVDNASWFGVDSAW